MGSNCGPLMPRVSLWPLLLCLACLQPVLADMYSSMESIQQAVGTEQALLQHLTLYLQQENHRLNHLTRFYEKVQASHQASHSPVQDPILAYTLLKRLQSEWMNVVYSSEADENIQDVYSLNVNGLVKGIFQRSSSSESKLLYTPLRPSKMSADDCFQIGKVAYDMEDYYHSIPWLEEAVSLFHGSYGDWFTEDEGSLEEALDYLAFSYFKAGNISHALDLSREYLLYDPDNGRVARNIGKYEQILYEKPAGNDVEEIKLQRPNVTHLRTRDLYEGLCQTLGSQPTSYEDPNMLCMYDTSRHPHLVLQPMKKEIVSLHPLVVLYHDFVSDSEAETIKDLASPWLHRSVVASGENQAEAEYRISKRKSPLYRTNTGNRLATFMIYLSNVDFGGSTAFVYANFSSPVVKNTAVFWWNLRRNGQGDEDTLHAGCPVIIGNKWVANKWIHDYGQEFKRPCGLSPED
ncbi:hypothetical protein XELAEV_18014113mg [Xenopus laevis]|uniref:Prolyl 4-hydroxylase alpha subunit domain-containing protein n=1 Tax=Xenopus laevis TaxID=8355 RepID=A0A974DS23_XENLA|nr:hypothetical protein XELAEV_18014113mg [Xenopus laevis]